MHENSLTYMSPAKINLFLNIVGRNENHYHLIQSFFILLDLHDTLTLTSSDEISCNVENAIINGENLIYKAARLMQTEFSINTGAHFVLNKNIPIGSGMGGGSSNAATAIKLLNSHWKLGLTLYEMAKIAVKIGADVPFFIYQQNALVEGIGEIINPIKLNKVLYILLIYPGFSCDTSLVYKERKGPFSNTLRTTINEEIHLGKNDLQEAAIRLHPHLEKMLELLTSQPGCELSRLSGSGSTCFGLFNTEHTLAKAFKHIKAAQPNLWVYYQHVII